MAHAVRVNVEVPAGTAEEARQSAESQARETAVLALWEKEQLTIREAAEELDLSYLDFLDLLAARGLPIARGTLDLEAIEEAERKLSSREPEPC